MVALPALAEASQPEASATGRGGSAATIQFHGAVPPNDWPDPQFCIQDLSGVHPALNNDLTADEKDLRITGHNTGSYEVVCRTENTEALEVDDWVQFQSGADPALRKTILRVTKVAPNSSFTVLTEFTAGKPVSSTPCTATIVQHGNNDTSAGGSVTSNVQRYADGVRWPIFLISRKTAHTALLRSCKRVLIVKKATDHPESIYWQADGQALRTLQGTRQSVAFSCHVPAPAPGIYAAAFINSGASLDGSEIATANSRTWVSIAADIPTSAPIFQAGAHLYGPAGAIFVLGEFTRCAGGPLPDGSFSTPRAQIVVALASVSPWIGASFTLPAVPDPPVVPVAANFICDVEQMSGGVIGDGVSYWMGLLEGQGALSKSFATHNGGAPAVFNPMMHQLIDPAGKPGHPNYYAYASGNFNCRGGKIVVYGAAGDTWNFVSWDIHGFVLFAGP
jgi:hypothetical protein